MKKILLSLILILASYGLQAQTWVLQTVPANTDINGIWAVNANIVWACGPAGYCIRTTDGGTTWTRVGQTALTGSDLYCITAVNDQIAITGAADGAIWRTTDGGTTWNFTIPTPAPAFMDVVHMFNATDGFAMSDPQPPAGLWLYYITTNAGANWTAGANRPPNVAGEAGWNGGYSALDTGHIWWGTNSTKIWKGSFRGPFTSAPTTGQLNSFNVAFNDATTGVAGFSAAMTMQSVNGGTSWATSGYTPPGAVYSMKGVPYSGYMWYGTTTGIFRSTTSGQGSAWTNQFPLTATNACFALTFLSVNLGWAGTGNSSAPGTGPGHIYKYTDNITGVGTNNGVPTSYSLEQNYPNPFNPTTNINFSIPKASNVTVKIYDVLGNEVKTVVNEFKNAGKYTENVDASGLSSGVYFYTIHAGDFTATKKMSLVK